MAFDVIKSKSKGTYIFSFSKPHPLKIVERTAMRDIIIHPLPSDTTTSIMARAHIPPPPFSIIPSSLHAPHHRA